VEIHIINLKNSNITTVTEKTAEYTTFSWSPDSNKIVFTSKDEFICTINIKENKFQKITKGDYPSWSPDSLILYRKYEGNKVSWPKQLNGGEYETYYAKGGKYYTIKTDGTNKELFLILKKN